MTKTKSLVLMPPTPDMDDQESQAPGSHDLRHYLGTSLLGSYEGTQQSSYRSRQFNEMDMSAHGENTQDAAHVLILHANSHSDDSASRSAAMGPADQTESMIIDDSTVGQNLSDLGAEASTSRLDDVSADPMVKSHFLLQSDPNWRQSMPSSSSEIRQTLLQPGLNMTRPSVPSQLSNVSGLDPAEMSTEQPNGAIFEEPPPSNFADLSRAPHSTAPAPAKKPLPVISFYEDPSDVSIKVSAAATRDETSAANPKVAVAARPKRVSWEGGQANLSGPEQHSVSQSQMDSSSGALNPAPFRKTTLPILVLDPDSLENNNNANATNKALPVSPKSLQLQGSSIYVDGEPEPEVYLPARSATQHTEDIDSLPAAHYDMTGNTTEEDPMYEPTQPHAEEILPPLHESLSRGRRGLLDGSGPPVPTPGKTPIYGSRMTSSPSVMEPLYTDYTETQGVLGAANQAKAGFEDSQLPDPPTSSPDQLLRDVDMQFAGRTAVGQPEVHIVPDSEEAARSLSGATPTQSSGLPLALRPPPTPKNATPKRDALREQKNGTLIVKPTAKPPQLASSPRLPVVHDFVENDPNDHDTSDGDEEMENTNYEEIPASPAPKAKAKAKAKTVPPVSLPSTSTLAEPMTTRRRSGASTATKSAKSESALPTKVTVESAKDRKSAAPTSKASIISKETTRPSRKRQLEPDDNVESEARPTAAKKAKTYSKRSKGKGKGKDVEVTEAQEIDQDVEMQDEQGEALNRSSSSMSPGRPTPASSQKERELCGIITPELVDLPVNRVFIYWKESRSCYPGEIIQVERDRVEVRFDENTTAQVAYKDLYHCKLEIGDTLFFTGDEATQDRTVSPFEPHVLYRIEWADKSGNVVPNDVELGPHMILACTEKSTGVKQRLQVESVRLPAATKKELEVLASRKLDSKIISMLQACANTEPIEEPGLVSRPRSVRSTSATSARALKTRSRSMSTSHGAPQTRTSPCANRASPSTTTRTAHQSRGNLFENIGFILTGYEEGNIESSANPDDPPPSHFNTSNKGYVEERINRQGGYIIKDLDELTSINAMQEDIPSVLTFKERGQCGHLKFIVLLSDKPRQSEKYLCAMALGIPCLSTRWVDESFCNMALEDWRVYLLGAGFSTSLGGHSSGRQSFLCAYNSFTLTDIEARHGQFQVFADQNFLILTAQKTSKGERKPSPETVRSVLVNLGARYVETASAKGSAIAEKAAKADYIVLLSEPSATSVPHSKRDRIINWPWIKECLIAGRALSPRIM